MAEGDGAAVAVQALRVQFQLTLNGEYLGALGFVDFQAVDVVQGQACAFQQQADGRGRTDTHDLRGHAHHGAGTQQRQGRSEFAGIADQRGGGAVHQCAAVASGLHRAGCH
ncbi:hypothetical protein D9M70_512070 [compost metagenome]